MTAGSRAVDTAARVVLLGCVKQKSRAAAPARNLYVSPLWKARRAYAEASGRMWFILSAQHGLVEPDELLAPYDLALRSLPSAARRAWAERVAESLERRLGAIDGRPFEIYTGGAYRSALAPVFAERGAELVAPLAHVAGVGEQIAWYARRMSPSTRRQEATRAEVAAAVATLDDSANIVAAASWPPSGLEGLHLPGLYAWWVDSEGVRMLGSSLGANVAHGRIYAGLTGPRSGRQERWGGTRSASASGRTTYGAASAARRSG